MRDNSRQRPCQPRCGAGCKHGRAAVRRRARRSACVQRLIGSSPKLSELKGDTTTQCEGAASDMADDEETIHPRLIGISGRPEESIQPRRGVMQPVLDRLGDVYPGQLLLATDFDGTLAPIVSRPNAAQALPGIVALLDRLIDLGVHVAVISGRSQDDLRRKLPMRGPRILGDNGIGQATQAEQRALDRFNGQVGRLIAREPGVWLECKPASTSVHYRSAPAAGPSVRARALPVADSLGLAVAMGRMVVEIRPRRADKARALAALITALQPKAVIYAGDDEPDHSVFRMLGMARRPHLSVGVSSDERPDGNFLDCDLVVEGPKGMADFLHRLLERLARHLPR